MKTSKTLRIAVAVALGIASEMAMSADGIILGTPATIATETDTGSNPTIKMPINIPTDKLVGRCVSKADNTFTEGSLANPCVTSSVPTWKTAQTVDAPLEIRFTLTGGATFPSAALPALTDFTCQQVRASGTVGLITSTAGDTTISATNAAAVLQTTPSTLSFKVDSGTIIGSCSATVSITLQSGQKDYGLVISAQHQYPVDLVSTSTAGSIITFGQAFNASITPTIVTIDVRDPSLSKQFVENGNTKSLVRIGTLNYTINAGAYYKVDTTNNNELAALADTNAEDYVMSTILTLSGTPLVGGADSIFLTTDTNACSETTKLGDAVVPASGSVTMTISNAGNELADGVAVCYKANTTAPIEKGSVTYNWVVASTFGKPNLDIPGDKQLSDFIKNGASIKVLNIPSPTNPTDLPFIRVYNMGPTTANVYGTLYSQGDASNVGAGDMLGGKSGVALLKLDPGAVGVIQAADIAKALGIDPLVGWNGRAWLQLEADSQLVRVQALIRSGGAGGTLVNASDRVTADSEAICRSSGCN